jgi:hypothetical protein
MPSDRSIPLAKYHGRNAVCYFSTTGTGAAVNVANLSAWSLSFATDKAEVTSFGEANKTYVQGLKDVSGSFEGFFDDVTTAALFTAADSTDGIKAYLYVSSNATARYFYGPAWLDMSISTPVGGAVTVSGTLAANGSWGSKLS